MLSEEIKKMIGTSGSVKVYEVERGAICRFADAIDDTNPLYQDDAYARNSRYGSIIAPPGFFGWPLQLDRGSALAIDIPNEFSLALEQAGYPLSLALDAGMEYEFFLPVRAGDVLAATTTVRNLRERTTDSGSIIVSILETTYRNQNGDLVAKQQATFIRRSIDRKEKE